MSDEKVLINFKMRESLATEMKQAAERLDIPYAQFIRMAIKKLLDELNLQKEK